MMHGVSPECGTPIRQARREMRPTVTGLFVGLLLGLVLDLEGFGEMLIVALFGAVGYLVMRVVEGELDLTQYMGGSSRSRR